MAREKNTAVLDASADHFPEHGPIDESGREVLRPVIEFFARRRRRLGNRG